MADIYDFNGIFIKPGVWYLFTILGPNLSAVLRSH